MRSLPGMAKSPVLPPFTHLAAGSSALWLCSCRTSWKEGHIQATCLPADPRTYRGGAGNPLTPLPGLASSPTFRWEKMKMSVGGEWVGVNRAC